MGRKSTASIAAAAARAAATAALADAATDRVLDMEAEDEESDAEALAELAQIGDGEQVRFMLSCISPLANRGQLDELSREEVPGVATMLRDRYGPGKYVVRALNNRGYIKGGQKTITISALTARRDTVSVAPTAQASQTGSMSEWLARQEVLEERRRQEAREDKKLYIELAIALGPALLSAFTGNRESMSSLLQGLVGAKELLGGGGSEKMVETLVKGIELGKEAGGGGESWPAVIKETLQSLAGSPADQRLIAGARTAVAGPAAPAVPYIPPPKPSGQPGAIPTVPNDLGVSPEIWRSFVLPLLNKLADELVEFAANDADPGLAAEALEAKIPRAARAAVTAEQLRAWLTRPDWWEALKGFRPALEPYHGYCDDVRQALVLMFTPKTEGAGEDAAAEAAGD